MINEGLDKSTILQLLKSTNIADIQGLFTRADAVRAKHVGDAIHVRALLNFSNCCDRMCRYCGLRAPNKQVKRYRLTAQEIIDVALQAEDVGYKSIVLQSGEDSFYSDDDLSCIIDDIKSKTKLALTLSFGERSLDAIRRWKTAGADRYLCKHETGDPALFALLHPDNRLKQRLKFLQHLAAEGFQTGSGIMLGIPGQTYDSVADDILRFKEMGMQMVGCGPYVHNPDAAPLPPTPNAAHYVQATTEMALKVTAFNRLVSPFTHIPATTALETVGDKIAQTDALNAGANVVMIDVTPKRVKEQYLIYPKSKFIDGINDVKSIFQSIEQQTGRPIGTTAGDYQEKDTL